MTMQDARVMLHGVDVVGGQRTVRASTLDGRRYGIPQCWLTERAEATGETIEQAVLHFAVSLPEGQN